MSDTSGFGIVPRYLRGTLTAYEIALYVALSWRADENGISWAGQATLAKDAGMSRSTVQRALDGLEAKGIVKSKPWANAKGRTSNVYALRIWADPVLSEGTIKRQDGHPMKGPTEPDQAERVSDVPSQGTPDVQIQAPDVPSQGTSPSEGVGVRLTDANPRVSQTQRKETHKNETQASSTAGPRSDGFREFWAAFPDGGYKGRKEDCRRVWLSMPLEERHAAYKMLQAYKTSVLWTDTERIATPYRWLENEPWRGDPPPQVVHRTFLSPEDVALD